MSMSLTLIEAVAGRDEAEAVSRELGLIQWDLRHDSSLFRFTRPFALTVIGNTLALWNRKQLGIKLEPDVDEVSLALVTDVWSRTYRSHAVTFASTAEARLTRNGIAIYPDQVATRWPLELLLPAIGDRRPVEALDEALAEIARRQGRGTADIVAMQLEYTRQEVG
jgi:hypothetical protein